MSWRLLLPGPSARQGDPLMPRARMSSTRGTPDARYMLLTGQLHDRRHPAPGDEVELAVVEPHRVGELEVGPEHARCRVEPGRRGAVLVPRRLISDLDSFGLGTVDVRTRHPTLGCRATVVPAWSSSVQPHGSSGSRARCGCDRRRGRASAPGAARWWAQHHLGVDVLASGSARSCGRTSPGPAGSARRASVGRPADGVVDRRDRHARTGDRAPTSRRCAGSRPCRPCPRGPADSRRRGAPRRARCSRAASRGAACRRRGRGRTSGTGACERWSCPASRRIRWRRSRGRRRRSSRARARPGPHRRCGRLRSGPSPDRGR